MDRRKVTDRAHQLADVPGLKDGSLQLSPEEVDDGARAKKGGWSTTAERHFGIRDEEMRQQSEDDAAERRAKIIARHRREWDGVRSLVYQAIRSADFDRAKLAKITAEAVRIVQDSERKAWDLDRGDESGGPRTIVIERHMGNHLEIQKRDGQPDAQD